MIEFFANHSVWSIITTMMICETFGSLSYGTAVVKPGHGLRRMTSSDDFGRESKGSEPSLFINRLWVGIIPAPQSSKQ